MSPHGFHVVGPKWGRRRPVRFETAFSAYMAADAASSPEAEGYLSAFAFGDEFLDHLAETKSTAGFDGDVGAAYLPIDIDRPDLAVAAFDAGRLAAYVAARYGLDDELLVFFSGRKGFHVCVPADVFDAAPSPGLPATFRRLAKALAEPHGVAIDTSIYEPSRLFRAPNSRHPATDLHKVPLDIDTLLRGGPDHFRALARFPRPSVVPPAVGPHPLAVADYCEAASGLLLPVFGRRHATGGSENGRLTRSTEDFLSEGAAIGERNNRLYSAARNFADFDDLASLVHGLLREPAERAGIRPGRVRAAVTDAVTDAVAAKRGDVPLAPATGAFFRHEIVREEREVRLAAAAADLAGYMTLDDLITAVLTPAAVACGLPPQEVRSVLRSALSRSSRRSADGLNPKE
ncbi:hypothetical protein [Alienimonas californiensis]|uniref:DNA primase n=1 Tax=Alienimonas californiensis TaxID=2527989 RepID=A0A517P5H3_9PLAN|nr:hypothetical protein [Alienimonas californiensis]QDT14605.1 hypothetical protein CA12_06810 [Alienimonas californiensis]